MTFSFSVLQTRSLSNLALIVDIFCLISGLKVNFDKSIILGINFEEAHLNRLPDVVGCAVGSWPIRYLGLPRGVSPLQDNLWDLVIVKRLDGWKKAYLSRGAGSHLSNLLYPHYRCIFCLFLGFQLEWQKRLKNWRGTFYRRAIWRIVPPISCLGTRFADRRCFGVRVG